MKPLSPFQYTRWEAESEHLIWLPPEFQEWEGEKSVYITGSRGTGKTTLLRGLEWSQRLENDSLKEQIRSDPFEKRYIGVYLNMPSYVLTPLNNYPQKRENENKDEWEEQRARIYSLYLEYQVLQLFVRAVQELRGKKKFIYSVEDELETVKQILNERPETKYFISENLEIYGLNELRLCFKRMHEHIRRCAISREELHPEIRYPSLQIGKTLEEIADILLDLCSKNQVLEKKENEDTETRWKLKVCIDQTESATSYQQKPINTMIVTQDSGNISFVVASLSGSMDINSTYIPDHPLTDADRDHYSLEKMPLDEFHRFVSGVTNLRFKKFTNNPDISVDLKSLLGIWDLNYILYKFIQIKRPENKLIGKFIGDARLNIGKKLFDKKSLPFEVINEESTEEEYIDDFLPEDMEDSIEIPPLYETYLIEKMDTKVPSENSEVRDLRRFKSIQIRKKMVSAMLCFCNQYNLSVPYAGYHMVMSMSDYCIRDFLRQMHEIYKIVGIPAEEFVKIEVKIEDQYKAITKSSEDKYRGISYEAAYYGSEIGRLVSSLGDITAEIQSAYEDPSSLTSTERGVFSIDYSSIRNQKDRKELMDILQIARATLCIKINEKYTNDNRIVFRLHRLFAPMFKYSYRGAYYLVPLNGEDLLKLCRQEDIKVSNKIKEKIISKITIVGKKQQRNSTLERWW